MLRKSLCSSVALLCGMANVCLAAEIAKPDNGPKADKAARSRIVSNVVVEPSSTLSDRESRELSFTAGRVLKHVDQARRALADNKQDQALFHVEQGLKLMAIIDQVQPRYKMKTSISSGEVLYSDEDEFSPEFVTIFEELDRRDIVSPVLRAKAAAAQQSSSQPANGRTAPPKGSIYVSQADAEFTSLKLDVELTRRCLGEAKKFLSQADPKEVDAMLATLQTAAVLLEYDEIDLPLEQAADNLKLAEAEMNGGRYEAAKSALNAAVDELQKYEKQAGESRSKEVKALHKEIRDLTAELDKGKPSEADAQRHASRISEWWGRATKWFRNR